MNDQYEICLAHSIRRANRVVSQIYNDYLSPLGLKISQFSILRVLHYTGSTTAKEIQNHLTMEQATVSRALKPLLRDGYIIASEGTDKRQKMLTLTKSGKSLYKQSLKPWSEAQSMMRKELGESLEHTLLDLSDQLVAIKD